MPSTQLLVLPYKSMAAALLFSIVLGPIGLLYASFWGGCLMILLGIIVISSKLFFPILLLWVVCTVWAVYAVERYNRKIIQDSLEKRPRVSHE